MNREFKESSRQWTSLGATDPLWAVLSAPEKKGGKWNLEEFLATGDADIQRFSTLIERHSALRRPFGDVLDFGCGVGRLSMAWSKHAKSVTGVDVASTMIDRAREVLSGIPHVSVRLNTEPNLGQFPSESFDIVASHITLQHIPPSAALTYLREFARITRPGGVVVFQIVTGRKPGDWKGHLADRLPWLATLHHRIALGFRVYVTPEPLIRAAMEELQMVLLNAETDEFAGDVATSRTFLFAKPVGSRGEYPRVNDPGAMTRG